MSTIKKFGTKNSNILGGKGAGLNCNFMSCELAAMKIAERKLNLSKIICQWATKNCNTGQISHFSSYTVFGFLNLSL